MKKKLAAYIRVLLVFLILATLAVCAIWLPRAIYYISDFLRVYLDNSQINSVALYILAGVVMFPLFAVFAMSFAFPPAIQKDMIFTARIAKLLKVIGTLLIGDCAFLCGVFLVLLCLRELFLTPLMIFVGVLGITVGCMLLVLSKYVEHAAALKEEADCTL